MQGNEKKKVFKKISVLLRKGTIMFANRRNTCIKVQGLPVLYDKSVKGY